MNFLQAAAASNLKLGNFDFANYSRIFAANNPKVAGEIAAVQQLLLFQQHFQQQLLLQLQAQQQQQPNKAESEDDTDTEDEDEEEEEALDLSQRSGPPPPQLSPSRPAPVKKQKQQQHQQQRQRKISQSLSADEDNDEPLCGRRLQAKQRSLIVSKLLEQSIYPSKAAIEQFFADHGRYFESCKQVQTKLRRYRQKMKPKSGEVEAQLMMAKQSSSKQ